MTARMNATASEMMLQIERLHLGAIRQVSLVQADVARVGQARRRAKARERAASEKARQALACGDEAAARRFLRARRDAREQLEQDLEPHLAALSDAEDRWREYVDWIAERLHEADVVYEEIRDLAGRTPAPRDAISDEARLRRLAEFASSTATRWDKLVALVQRERARGARPADLDSDDLDGELAQLRRDISPSEQGVDRAPGSVGRRIDRTAPDDSAATQEAESRLSRVLFVTALPLEAAALRDHLPEGGVPARDRHGTIRYSGHYQAPNGQVWDARVIASGAKNAKAGALTALAAAEFVPDYCSSQGSRDP